MTGPIAPELSRPFPLARLATPSVVTVETSEAERQAIARRLGLRDLPALVCRFELSPGEPGQVLASGRLRARVVQTCVVTIESFSTEIDESFAVRFVPEGQESAALNLDAEDEIPYRGSTLELGEATTEQLALALDPFPRKPGATLEDRPPPPGPFEKLARLRSAVLPAPERGGRNED